MMSFFRAFLNTWAARAFFVVLVAAFALWGVADVVRNMGGSGALATVGDRRIEPAEFQYAFRRNLAQVQRALGNAEPSPEVRRSAANEALERLIVQAAVADEVARLGLLVPDAALRQATYAIPAFKGPTGAFDRANFDAVLRNNGLTESRFLDLMRADIGQQQLMVPVGAGVAAPDTLVKQVYGFARETRSADVVELPFAAAPAPPAPTAEDLQREYENDPARWSAPTFRRVKLVVLSPATLAGGIDVSADDIKTYYDAHKADYDTPEKRAADVIVAPNEAAAKTLLATWSGGADWAAMQAAANKAGGSALHFDLSTEDQFPSAELGKAVFAGKPDTVTGPIASPGGPILLRVTQVAPAQSRTLAEATDDIRRKIALERATDSVYDRANKLDEALSAGTSFDDLPGDVGAAGVEGTLDAAGNTPDGEPAPIPGSPALRSAILTAAFAAHPGDPPRLIEGPDQSYYALQVEDEIAPKLKPFDEVKDAVAAAWEADQRRHEQDEAAAALLHAAQEKHSLDDAATIAGLHIDRTPPLTRDGQDPHVPPQVIAAMFRLKPGETTTVETPDAFWVVSPAAITEPDMAKDPVGAAQVRDGLTRALQADMQIVLATALRDRAAPKVNREMLDSLIR